MPIPFGSNISLYTEAPNFTRDMFETKADMKAFAEYKLPPLFISVCIEDGKIYLYNKNNTVDEETGKWRVVETSKVKYNDIEGRPLNLSDLVNDLGFVNNLVDDLVNYYQKTETYSAAEIDSKLGALATLSMLIVDDLPSEGNPKIIYLVKKVTGDGYVEWIYTLGAWASIGDTDVDLSEYVKSADLAKVATTGNWNDLDVKPVIPTLTSELTNDSNFGPIDDAIKTENNTYSAQKIESLIASSTGSALERDITASVTVGGINEGQLLEVGTSFTDFVSKLLEKYMPPVISISISPSTTLYEKGQTVNPVTVTASVTKKSEDIEKVQFLVAGVIKETKTESVASGGTFTYEYDTDITANTTFRVTTNDVDTKTSKYADKTISFVLPYYYGVCDASSIVDLTGLTKDLSVKGSKTYSYTADNQYCVIVYDSSYADLTSIKDQNNFENLSNFTKKTVTVGDYTYKYYITNGPKTLSGFKFTFA